MRQCKKKKSFKRLPIIIDKSHFGSILIFLFLLIKTSLKRLFMCNFIGEKDSDTTRLDNNSRAGTFLLCQCVGYQGRERLIYNSGVSEVEVQSSYFALKYSFSGNKIYPLHCGTIQLEGENTITHNVFEFVRTINSFCCSCHTKKFLKSLFQSNEGVFSAQCLQIAIG